MIDYCYTCGKELDWNEVLIYWNHVKTPTDRLDGELKAFCNKGCASKIGDNISINTEPEQLTLDI